MNKVLYISFSERRHLLFTFLCISLFQNFILLYAAAAKSLQLCPTLCDPIDGKAATGDSINNKFVFDNLRGKKGTTVVIDILKQCSVQFRRSVESDSS